MMSRAGFESVSTTSSGVNKSINELVDETTRLYFRREALLKTSSIARAALAKNGKESVRLRNVAEETKDKADEIGRHMVEIWMRD